MRLKITVLGLPTVGTVQGDLMKVERAIWEIYPDAELFFQADLRAFTKSKKITVELEVIDGSWACGKYHVAHLTARIGVVYPETPVEIRVVGHLPALSVV